MFALVGLALDREACDVLYRLAVRGLAAERERTGGGLVPARTAALLRMLAAVAQDSGVSVMGGSGGGVVAAVPREDSERDYFTASEAAGAWGCTDSYVRRLCREFLEGEGIAVKEAMEWRLPVEFVRAHREPPQRSGSVAA